MLNVYFLRANREENRVISIPDGDSIQLYDGRRVRMLGIDAPEQDRCMAKEARERFEGLAKYSHVRSSRTDELKAASDLARQEKRGIYCDHYDLVIIDEAFGDAWFCTEKEAQTAGFTRASGCR